MLRNFCRRGWHSNRIQYLAIPFQALCLILELAMPVARWPKTWAVNPPWGRSMLDLCPLESEAVDLQRRALEDSAGSSESATSIKSVFSSD